MIDCIFYIGGASGSGKSHAARMIREKYRIPVINLDDYYNIFHPTCNEDISETFMRNVSEHLVEDLIKFQGTGILEGGWIDPNVAIQIRSKFDSKFKPVYAGYINDNAQNRLNFLKSNPGHWLLNEQEDFAISFLNKQISDSGDYMNKCRQGLIDYIDFSDPTSGCNEMLLYFEKNILLQK
jgi:hypothetical protein